MRGTLAAAAVLAAASAALLAPASGAGERRLGAPVYDTEAETTHRVISWDDFKSLATGRGVSPWGEWVFMVTRLRLSGYEIETHREDDGAWVATVGLVRPYAVMDKLLSGVSSTGRQKSALAHQQRLFDLAETAARRLAVELDGVRGRGEVPYDAEQDLRYQIDAAFDRARHDLDELQRRYSDEARSGEDRAEETRWAKEIARMFDEATAALAAVLAR